MLRTAKNDNFKVTEVDIVYRSKSRPSERPQVKCPDDAYNLLLRSWDMDKIELQEQFRIMLLDRRNGCMGISTIATGGISACLVDVKIAFALALKASASSIILAHNHPAGSMLPSEEDKNLTAKFAQAGRIFDLPVRDHLIVTKSGYTSLAQEGIL